MRLLLVEDDTLLGRVLQQGLAEAGFAVDWVRDGSGVELATRDGTYDVAVLDLGLPGKDGMTVLRDLRSRRNELPVIIVTARDGLSDRVAGLNSGADDYVVKPFEIPELVARVRALMRRRAGVSSPVFECGALSLDPAARQVRLDGREVTLSAREFALLEALMQRPGDVLSRQQLEAVVYGWGDEVASNAIEVHLHNLRRKLGKSVIANVRGAGYKVTPA